MSSHHTSRHAAARHDLVPPPPETAVDFPVLDTLRAVGAFAVLTTHVAFWSGATFVPGLQGTLLARLDVGVAIFFVLSGFLLSRGWILAATRGGRAPRTRSYLWKRVVRIFPVYFVAAVPALWLLLDNRDLDVGDRISALLLLSTTTGGSFPSGLTHMWSLAVEMAFYLVLPLLMLVLVGRRGWSARRLVVGVALLWLAAIWWHLDLADRIQDHVAGTTTLWLPAYIGWFAMGIGLAAVQVCHDDAPSGWTRGLATLGRQPGACWTLVAGLLLLSATPLAGPTQLVPADDAAALTKSVLYAGIGFLIVLTGVFTSAASRYVQVLTLPWLRRLGWISYGVFCLHLPLLHFVMWVTGWPLFEGRGIPIWLLTVALSLVTADLVYRFVERPALRWKRLVR
ncbi:acyltransferase [Nocardioides panacisoli]|uniref:acyltransferase family protein n=1 Tax=Nocardioides panacisoli TaxID=627624 RepID=UPI001C63708F|nr:acyltransferase [Nocardioides panacisoli]QYJ04791.1 acyltransferase [Nocardioides panacisoli]